MRKQYNIWGKKVSSTEAQASYLSKLIEELEEKEKEITAKLASGACKTPEQELAEVKTKLVELNNERLNVHKQLEADRKKFKPYGDWHSKDWNDRAICNQRCNQINKLEGQIFSLKSDIKARRKQLAAMK